MATKPFLEAQGIVFPLESENSRGAADSDVWFDQIDGSLGIDDVPAQKIGDQGGNDVIAHHLQAMQSAVGAASPFGCAISQVERHLGLAAWDHLAHETAFDW